MTTNNPLTPTPGGCPELALTLYQGGEASEGRAAIIAGMNRWAFHKLLGDRKVARNYGLDDLQHDLVGEARLNK